MSKRKKSTGTMNEALLQAISESDLSFIEMERQTGVTRQIIMGFAKGERTIRLDNADKLAEFFGLEVVKRKGK